MACAASPIRSALSRDHGQARTVAMRPSGADMSWSAKSGISGIASAKYVWPNACASAAVRNSSNEGEPSKARNKVQVKLPSRLGSAINMKLPRGQMCNASRCMPLPGGIVNSL